MAFVLALSTEPRSPCAFQVGKDAGLVYIWDRKRVAGDHHALDPKMCAPPSPARDPTAPDERPKEEKLPSL